MFNWKWYLTDLKQDKDVTVFSCFSCGGGSTMGYKRAGFKVIGNCEIDKRMNTIYKKNHHPKYNFLMDLRQFNKLDDLPEELYHLDILDGSPPCSTFSTAGDREKAWGKEKVFREGQKKQTLDDLFFVFLETVEKLKPKIVVAENVTGLLKGNAKGYVNEIVKRFHSLGYDVQLFQLNAALMDVPQARERVFFIANNQNYPKLKLQFNHKLITFGEVRTKKGKPFIKPNGVYETLLKSRMPTDTCIADISMRLRNRNTGFNNPINNDDRVASTLISGGRAFRGCDGLNMTDDDCRNIQTFPQDYDFGNEDVKYICGMSVPPNMMANIAIQIYNQWLNH
jgi:DNA (cytosine-5)-methyltransferase 1